MTVPVLTDHFATLAPHYDAVLSDVWGVVHNGVTAVSGGDARRSRASASAAAAWC